MLPLFGWMIKNDIERNKKEVFSLRHTKYSLKSGWNWREVENAPLYPSFVTLTFGFVTEMSIARSFSIFAICISLHDFFIQRLSEQVKISDKVLGNCTGAILFPRMFQILSLPLESCSY